MNIEKATQLPSPQIRIKQALYIPSINKGEKGGEMKLLDLSIDHLVEATLYYNQPLHVLSMYRDKWGEIERFHEG